MVDKMEERIEENVETVLEEETEGKKKVTFKSFIKKYGFYIGISLIMLVTLIILFSDREVSQSGDVNYDNPVYYITGNNLYIKERGKDEVLISSKMFQSLAREGINIHSITTSEIKISCLIEAKYGELALRVLHDVFGLKSGAGKRELDL